MKITLQSEILVQSFGWPANQMFQMIVSAGASATESRVAVRQSGPFWWRLRLAAIMLLDQIGEAQSGYTRPVPEFQGPSI